VDPLSGGVTPAPARAATTCFSDDVSPKNDTEEGDSGGEEGLAHDQCVVEVVFKGTFEEASCTMHALTLRFVRG
jgi:hypothetical protein